MKAIPLSIGLLCSILASCTVLPTVVRKADGTMVATTGGGILNQTEGLEVEITLPDGTSIKTKLTKNDNRKVLSDYLFWKGLKPVIEGGANALVKGTKDPQAIPGAAKGEALVKGTVDPQAVPGAAKGEALLQSTGN